MSTQFPQPQPLQQQQPPVVFPNSVTNQATPSSHSDGSFGTVFIVLAVIVVVSAIACCLGRLCNRRHNKQKPSKQSKQKNDKFRPNKEKEREGGDIEFGFEKGLSSKPVSNGDHHGGGGGPGGGRGFKTFHNGRINNSNGHHGPMNGHGPANGHFKGVTIAEPVFSVGEPKPGLGP